MVSYLRLIVRFSHVFFISTCCDSNGAYPIQEDSKRPRFPASRSDVQEGSVPAVSEQEEGSEEETDEEYETIKFN